MGNSKIQCWKIKAVGQGWVAKARIVLVPFVDPDYSQIRVIGLTYYTQKVE